MSDDQQLDKRILGLTPDMVIGLGVNVFLAGLVNSPMTVCAAKSIAELEGLIDSFPTDSRERIYLLKLRLAAVGFARGLERRKGDLAERLTVARERKDLFVREFAKGQRFNTMAISGFNYVLVGGFVYALIRAAALMPALAQETHKMDLQYAGLATAIGATLLTSWVKEWWLRRRTGRAFKRYESALEGANQAYVREVIKEYHLAADTAENAWRWLTGANSNTTRAFEQLLIGVMGEGKGDQSAVPSIPELTDIAEAIATKA